MLRGKRQSIAGLALAVFVSAFSTVGTASATEGDGPVLVEASPRAALPNETVQLIGEGLAGGTIAWLKLPDTDAGQAAAQLAAAPGQAELEAAPEGEIQPLYADERGIAGVLPAHAGEGQYALWGKDASGRLSNPLFINKTDVYYVFPNVVNVAKTAEVTVVGMNLAYRNGTEPDDALVFLRSSATGDVIEASPKRVGRYEIVAELPAGLGAGQYDELWVNNGHGGAYGWSSTPIVLTDDAPRLQEYDVTNAAFGAVPNDGIDDGPAIQQAIDRAAADGGGIVRLPEGVFHLDKEGAPPAPGLTKLVAESVFGGTPSYGVDREYFRAFDSNSTTFYDFSGSGSGYAGIDLGAGNERTVTAIRYFPRPATNATIDMDMVGGKFQGSTDGETYVDLYTVTSKPSFNGNVVAVADGTAYRYLRYMQPTAGKKGYIAEVEFFAGTASGALAVGPKPETVPQKLTLKEGVTLQGAGRDRTTLKYLDTGPIGGRDNGEGPEILEIAGSRSGLADLRIEGSDSIDRGITIRRSVSDVTIRSVELRNWFPGLGKKNMFGGIWADGGNGGLNRVTMQDSVVESGGSVLNKLYNSKVSGNRFEGRAWTPVTLGNAYQNIITDNAIDGRDEEGKRSGARGFNFILRPHWGGFKPVAMNYIARNDTQYVGNEKSPTNDGEILLFDALPDVDTEFTGSGNRILHYGSVASAADAGASLKGMNWEANALKDEYALVVEGKGLGQVRRIVGNTADAFTVDEAWTIRPDATSRIAVSRFFYKNIVADNTASNNKGNDIRAYGQVIGNIFDNNVSTLGDGASPTARNGGTAINSFDRNLTTFHPAYYNVIQDSSGARAYINFGGNLRIDSPRSVSTLGNVIKRNDVDSLSLEAGGYDFFPAPKPSIRYNVFERNVSAGQAKIASPVAHATILRNNMIPGETPEAKYYDFGTNTLIYENDVKLLVAPPKPPEPPQLPGDGPMPTPPGNKLVLQEGVAGYDGAADASLMSHWQGVNNNNGAYGEFETARYNGGGVDDKYALIRFDMSMVPPDRTITGAYLELYHTQTRSPSSNLKTVDVHRILEPWEEGTGHGSGTSIDGNPVGTVADGIPITGVTLNTRPQWETGPETTLHSRVTSYIAGRWYYFDVTEAARTWATDPDSNFGVVLLEDVPSTANGTRTFASSQYSDVTLRPKLTVFYSGEPIRLPPDTTAPTDVLQPAATSGDGTVTLTWNDAPDSDIVKVNVYEGERLLAQIGRGEQEATLEGLTNGRTYALRIANEDGSGNESPGVSIQATPRAEKASFWRGVNLNGAAVSVDGNDWLSYAEARSDGLVVSAVGGALHAGTTSVFPLPFEDDYDFIHAMNTNVTASEGALRLEQQAPGGKYRVYLRFLETGADRSRSFHVEAEGVRVATNVGRELRNHHARYGPFDAEVRDGALTIDVKSGRGNPALSGIEIYKDYRDATTLASLTVNGATVTDFVYDAKEYAILLPPDSEGVPLIAAEPMESGSTVSIEPPAQLPGVARIEVVSGDGAMSSLYTVRIDRATAPTATVTYSPEGGTNGDVVATLHPSEPVTVLNNDGAFARTFAENGSFTFEFSNAAGIRGAVTASVYGIDKAAPTVSIAANPQRLWPPNHKLVPVDVELAADGTGSEIVSITLDSITSSEPDDGQGDGHTEQDVQGAEFGTDDRSFLLRAERSGGGSGRVYTAVYTVTDAAGNRTTVSVDIAVSK